MPSWNFPVLSTHAPTRAHTHAHLKLSAPPASVWQLHRASDEAGCLHTRCQACASAAMHASRPHSPGPPHLHGCVAAAQGLKGGGQGAWRSGGQERGEGQPDQAVQLDQVPARGGAHPRGSMHVSVCMGGWGHACGCVCKVHARVERCMHVWKERKQGAQGCLKGSLLEYKGAWMALAD